MSADNRSVHTDALATLGTVIDETQQRDAIHLAVEPVEAGGKLAPGQHVFLRDGKAFGTTGATGQHLVGIVDPFLDCPVQKGQRFWLVVYPRQITSLRHVWEHPDFPNISGLTPRMTPASIAASEVWIRDFVSHADCPDYDTLMKAAIGESINDERDWDISARKDGEYLHFSGLDAHGAIPPEFWDHVEIVTGKKITNRPEYFSCAC